MIGGVITGKISFHFSKIIPYPFLSFNTPHLNWLNPTQHGVPQIVFFQNDKSEEQADGSSNL